TVDSVSNGFAVGHKLDIFEEDSRCGGGCLGINHKRVAIAHDHGTVSSARPGAVVNALSDFFESRLLALSNRVRRGRSAPATSLPAGARTALRSKTIGEPGRDNHGQRNDRHHARFHALPPCWRSPLL